MSKIKGTLAADKRRLTPIRQIKQIKQFVLIRVHPCPSVANNFFFSFAFALSLLAHPLFAEVNGIVFNGTTGKPQANQKVTLYRFGQGGMEPVDSTQTDATGAFTIPKDTGGSPGPSMIRTEVDDVTYNKMIPPGAPSTGLSVTVYNASKTPGQVKISKHMLLFEPGNGQLTVNETYLVDNPGKTTWRDPAAGTVKFYAPADAQALDVKGTAPDGMAIPAPNDKTSTPNVYAIKFEIKPGQTRFDLTYSEPYTMGSQYEGKVVTKDDNTYLIVPNGVTLTAEHVTDLGTEPRTKAHIFGLQGTSYNINLTGAEVAGPAEAAAQPAEAGPQIEEIMPHILKRMKLILGIALGILALGFAILYRKETHAS